jgi:hypothetical protein
MLHVTLSLLATYVHFHHALGSDFMDFIHVDILQKAIASKIKTSEGFMTLVWYPIVMTNVKSIKTNNIMPIPRYMSLIFFWYASCDSYT